MKGIPPQARVFVLLTSVAGASAMIWGGLQWQSENPTPYLFYLLAALLASGMKVRLPGITATMSVNFMFILLGVLQFGYGETILMGCLATLLQCFWRAKDRPRPIQVIFNVSSMAVAILVCHSLFTNLKSLLPDASTPLILVAAASSLFLANTLPVSTVVAMTEQKSVRKTWSECYFWSFPYYLAGAVIAWLVSLTDRTLGWETGVLVLPMVVWLYRSYRLYLDRLDAEKTHALEMASLHLRTIEALALAIDAKDHATHAHLRRVRVYATEIGREMGLGDPELDALRAASLLHDIGKLAVPEHILSKPGRLTPEEFEKVKIHPVVGGEILERVQFPYPVAPIVRAHHEKWDGSGYPFGLKGRKIPIGARILAAVDCLDALASDRQYRRALPLHEAMWRVEQEAGRSFDPKVVEILRRRYLELEQLACAEPQDSLSISKNIRVERGESPAAGFERSLAALASHTCDGSTDFLTSIAGARQEAQVLFELAQSLGNSLSLDETLSVFSTRLQHLVPYDSIAIYLCQDGLLVPRHVGGDNFRLFSSLRIPPGEGLSGWVATNRKAIINGNPSVEPGYLNDLTKFSTLNSALAVPLEGTDGVLGVLTLYKAERDAFTNDHLRILSVVSAKLAFSIENAQRFELAENSATTDYLTDLPNARSLFLHLDREIARCKRDRMPLTLLVCDLNGFKTINDKMGHLEGNRVLRLVACGFKEASREYDYVARMGGDEFVIVAPGLRGDAVSDLANRLRVVAQKVGIAVGADVALSASIGQAAFPEDGTDAEKLLSEADRRMYSAKRIHHASFGKPALKTAYEPASYAVS